MSKLNVAFDNSVNAHKSVDFGVPVAAHAGALTTNLPGTYLLTYLLYGAGSFLRS